MSSSLSQLPSTPCLQLPPIFLWLVIFTPELSFKHQTQSTSNSSGSYWAFYFLPKYSPLLFSQLAKWHYNLPRHSKQKHRVIHSTPFFLTQADSVYPFIISSLNCDAPLVLLSQVTLITYYLVSCGNASLASLLLAAPLLPSTTCNRTYILCTVSYSARLPAFRNSVKETKCLRVHSGAVIEQ